MDDDELNGTEPETGEVTEGGETPAAGSAYATVADVEARMTRTLSSDEEAVCAVLLEDAAVMIDGIAPNASDSAKKVVSCRIVIRAMGDGSDSGAPIGATQGSVSALGYSQSWTLSNGSVGELYIGKGDRQLLGLGRKIGSYSPVQELVPEPETEAAP